MQQYVAFPTHVTSANLLLGRQLPLLALLHRPCRRSLLGCSPLCRPARAQLQLQGSYLLFSSRHLAFQPLMRLLPLSLHLCQLLCSCRFLLAHARQFAGVLGLKFRRGFLPVAQLPLQVLQLPRVLRADLLLLRLEPLALGCGRDKDGNQLGSPKRCKQRDVSKEM